MRAEPFVRCEALDSEFSDQAKNKGLDWRLVHCGLAIHSDRRLLAQIARNLVSNAIRYTDKGRILVGCRRRGSSVRIEIWDTGIGIAEEQLPRIFDEHYQVADDARRTGLGLGLAIVQRLGELLRHPIGVRSWMDKGSMFSVEVSLAGAMPPPARRVEEAQRGKTDRSATILVIEDEPTVRETLAATLRAEGHRVAEVSNGQPALDVLTKGGLRPDLVISDYNLPGKFNGAELAATVRTTLGWQVPAIILSGDANRNAARYPGKGAFLHH